MIKVEGYKAFRGVMRITPKNMNFEPYELCGEFLYKPSEDCWYGCGRSFSSQVCMVVFDQDERGEM